MKLKEFLQVLSLNPKYRITRHVEYLREHIKIPKGHDKENFETVYNNFCQTSKRLTIYHWIRNVTFVLLYFSIILTIAKDILPGVTEVLAPVGQIANLIGFSLLTIVFVIVTKAITAVRTDLIVEHSHLVAIAVKHNKNFKVHPEYKWGLFKDYE